MENVHEGELGRTVVGSEVNVGAEQEGEPVYVVQ